LIKNEQQELRGFERRLLVELRGYVAERPRPRRAAARARAPLAWRGRLALVGAAASVAVVAVAAGVPFLSRGGSAAYAVTTTGDRVRVTIREFEDPAGLERQLRAAGVNAVIYYLKPGEMCGPRAGAPAPDAVEGGATPTNGGLSFTIDRSKLGDAQALVIGVEEPGSPAPGSSIQIGPSGAKAKTCDVLVTGGDRARPGGAAELRAPGGS
jgi:hypothetical protein